MIKKRYMWLCNIVAVSALAPMFAALYLIFSRRDAGYTAWLMFSSPALLILSIIIGNALLKCPHCGEKGIGGFYKLFKESNGERRPFCLCCGNQVGFE